MKITRIVISDGLASVDHPSLRDLINENSNHPQFVRSVYDELRAGRTYDDSDPSSALTVLYAQSA